MTHVDRKGLSFLFPYQGHIQAHIVLQKKRKFNVTSFVSFVACGSIGGFICFDCCNASVSSVGGGDDCIRFCCYCCTFMVGREVETATCVSTKTISLFAK